MRIWHPRGLMNCDFVHVPQMEHGYTCRHHCLDVIAVGVRYIRGSMRIGDEAERGQKTSDHEVHCDYMLLRRDGNSSGSLSTPKRGQSGDQPAGAPEPRRRT